MAGGGRYNEHSQPQHVAGGDGVPLLVRAGEAIPLDRERGVVVADYGSSQGRNSLVPMGAVVEQLRKRLGADAPISIVHTDLPSNDFAALFTTLEAEHVAIGWSSIAVHCYRTLSEFVEPLGKPTPAGSFELAECSETDLADPLWADYQQSGNVGEYATGVADFLRAFSEPSLFSGIAAERSPQATAKLADEFYGRVRDAVVKQPGEG